MFKKILVPLDGSDMAEVALHAARELAEGFGSEITVLQVLTPVSPSYYGSNVDVTIVADIENSARVNANTYIHQTLALLEDRGLKAKAALEEGMSVPEVILTYAEKNQIDLIAMSTHGRSGLGRWLMGSVADRVVNTCNVPILLVRPDLSTK
jgi:nucleotide-binding universal stress UspA family protein